MKVATFNVNSVRARLPVLRRWLTETSPDIVALQETKVEDLLFPLLEFKELGYDVAFHGQQKYNGVAIASRLPMENVVMGYSEGWPVDCRVIRADVGGLTLVNTYVPNGTAVGTDKFEYKLKWLAQFEDYVLSFARPSDKVLWLGDINIAPTADDVYDPVKFEGSVGFHPDERAALANLMTWGWTDCFRKFQTGTGHFTYWEFFIRQAFKRNMGWRIDHVYASPGLVDACAQCEIDRGPRHWERPSDHTPVIARFEV